MDQDILAKLGAPDLRLGNLQIWIRGRQFPGAMDYWDGNWLLVTAHCGAPGASVFATGPILHLPELVQWRADIENLATTLTGEANLVCLEPGLSVSLKASSLGHIAMEAVLTPDPLAQRHWFSFELDQSYLAPLLQQCHSVLQASPIRGSKADRVL